MTQHLFNRALQPGLGKKGENIRFYTITKENHKYLHGNEVTIQQYSRWIAENAETLRKKRQQLNIANDSLTISVLCFLFILALIAHITYVNIVLLLVIDVVLVVIVSSIVVVLLRTRDEWLNWKSWPITEQQKELFPYVDTPEFFIVSIISLFSLLSIGGGWYVLANSFFG